ncbi:hypothetical protein IHV10_22315 [Fictibacillus sp. 5RED26]|uniref:hypothetical protein n=1 Tax=Fictibacillus sp. 5RED26 TaxID=2745876 RepID=UPI0018CE3397|nr:hypothetical protein [Fictibacillus sp. 5RED26]MBH0159108.1 hypothetical protein [Fictibacillus sp. 5RED26]
MIDLRDHGGSFGGSKYRKGYNFLPHELGITVVPVQDLLVYSTDMRIDGMVMDTDGTLWTCGYSTSSGARYLYKSIWDGSINYLSYKQVLSVGGLNSSAYPNQLFIIPGQPYIYMNDGTFKRYNKDTGTLINSFSRYLATVTLSRDGKYIFAYDDSTQILYKLNPDLSIVAQMTTVSRWNNDYSFVAGRYFVMFNHASLEGGVSPYKTVLYDMETMNGPIWKLGQNQNEGVSSSPMTNIIIGSYLYKIRGQYIHKYRLSDMNKEQSVRVLTDSYSNLTGMYDYNSDYLGVFYQGGSNSPRVLRLLKKSDLLTFVDLPYGLKLDYNINVLQWNETTNEYIYSNSEGAWKVKRAKAGFTIQ